MAMAVAGQVNLSVAANAGNDHSGLLTTTDFVQVILASNLFVTTTVIVVLSAEVTVTVAACGLSTMLAGLQVKLYSAAGILVVNLNEGADPNTLGQPCAPMVKISVIQLPGPTVHVLTVVGSEVQDTPFRVVVRVNTALPPLLLRYAPAPPFLVCSTTPFPLTRFQV